MYVPQNAGKRSIDVEKYSYYESLMCMTDYIYNPMMRRKGGKIFVSKNICGTFKTKKMSPTVLNFGG